VFADRSDALLADAGARVVTSDTIPHATSVLAASTLLAPAIAELGLEPLRADRS
jgi:hypothetical protein